MSEVLERVRMCLAEAGYPPTAVHPSALPEATCGFDPEVPARVAWMAMATAGAPNACWRCTEKAVEAHIADDLEQWRIWIYGCPIKSGRIEDCGVSRG